MVRLLKRFCWVGLALGSVQCASAFSLLGPIPAANAADSWQSSALGYNYTGSGDVGTPKNLGEEYRWLIPKLYYSFDQKFLDYFGSNGVYAVDQAFAILNGVFNFTNVDGRVITNVDGFSSDLSEFPLETRRVNYRAQALGLADVKSQVLSYLVEELGLADSTRWTWALRFRSASPFYYWVVKRNFDPVTFEPSSYVNGTLYSYSVQEFTGTATYGDAVEIAADPYAFTSSAIASGDVGTGGFYLGLTRDDVGGLRYLWRTNNMNVANVGTNVQQLASAPVRQIVVSSNLALLVAQSLTNDPTTLATAYPGLVSVNVTSNLLFVTTTNVVSYYTNLPWAPANSAAILVLVTNTTTIPTMHFHHYFANVWTNSYFTNGTATLLTTNISVFKSPWGQVGTNTLQTNITYTTVPALAGDSPLTGDFYIIPTNWCNITNFMRTSDATNLVPFYTAFSNTLVANVTIYSNALATATNAPGVTNVSGQSYSQTVYYGFTNHYFLADVMPCPTNANTVALLQGMGRIQFVRRDYDSLLSGFFLPVTNTYPLVAVTNNTPFVRYFQRIVSNADILITAQDLSTAPTYFNPATRSTPNFDTSRALTGLAGPGTIAPSFTITFNKIGPTFFNTTTNNLLTEDLATTFLQWASFDGTTNEPVVYPSSTSIANLENQVLMDITPANLSAGKGQVYSVQFGGLGGSPPYQWSLSPVAPVGLQPGWTAGLPPGLNLSPDGTIVGTPTQAGTFAFVVRMTDIGSRYVDRGRVITISP